MKIEFTSRSPLSSKTESLLVPVVRQAPKKPTRSKPFAAFSEASQKEAELFDSYFDGALSAAMIEEGFQAKKGQRMSIFAPDPKTKSGVRHIELLGVSSDAQRLSGWGPDEWRVLGSNVIKTALQFKRSEIAVSLCFLDKSRSEEIAQLLVEGLRLASYTFLDFKGKTKSRSRLASLALEVTLYFKKSARPSPATLRAGHVIGDCVSLVRDLVNTPPSDMAPKHIVQHAKKVAKGKNSLIQTKVLNKSALERMGANVFLAVGRGSSTDPYLIHMTYRPARKSKNCKRIVLVGKGVTFDTGGLSMKLPAGMIDMKCDMGGAAVVIGVMQAIRSLPASLRPRAEVHGLIATSENMVGPDAVKPGDVATAINGKTVEILNTDAEGRLLLADTLCYSEKLKPDVLIDIATLTGSCVAALGDSYAGLFSDDADLVSDIIESGRLAGERFWQLPLASESYKSLLESPIADLKNSAGSHPGSILAALFLKEFVPKNTSWAHLDIAGPAFLRRAQSYNKKGGSGFAVRTLLRFLQQA